MPAVDAKAINIYMSVTGPFSAQMAQKGADVQRFGNQANAGMAKAQSGAARFGATASKIATGGAVAIAVGLALSAKAAITFESSFAGVRKTIDTTEAGFEKLALGIRKMATEIPIGVNELNRIAELGGQLGVEAPDLLEFTETIALIGVTTTLSTDEAATGFARLDNIMGLGQESFEEMGSTVVDLGNNFAATEDEILNFALRVAPIGATVGLATDEVLAIATAFTSVGVRAERGGTAIQKTFIEIAEAAQNGGVELAVFAEVAGMTSDQFKKLAETDPAEAFEQFIIGLSRVQEQGGNVFQTLDNLHLGNTRVVQSLLAMANANGVLTDAFDLSEDAWEDNIALLTEAEKRFETTASQLTILKNNVIDVGIGIGQELLPVLGDLAGGLGVIIDWILGLHKNVKIAIGVVGGLAIALVALNAHPVILALTIVAGLVAVIGRNAARSEARVDALKEAIAAGGELERGVTQLKEILRPELVDQLFRLGFTPADIEKALFGTKQEFEEFEILANRAWHAATGADISKLSLGREIGKERENLEALRLEEARLDEQRNRATILGVELPGSAEQIAAQERGRRAVAALIHARQKAVGGVGSGSGINQNLIPAFLKEEQIDDIEDAVGEYRDVFKDAFAEIDDEVKNHIDLFYEFGDDLEWIWDDIVATVTRQTEAFVAFERFFLENPIDATIENWIRNAAPSPEAKEAFLREWELDPAATLAAIQQLIDGPKAALDQLVVDIFAARYDNLELMAGTDLLAAMASVVNEVTEDDEFNVVQAWLAVMMEAQDRMTPEQFSGVMDLLRASLADPAFIAAMDLTEQQIYDLIEALNSIPGEVDTEVTVSIFTQKPGDADDFDYYPLPPLFDQLPDEGLAQGGFAFAGKPYRVGELGPELFVPFTSGTIIPNDKLGSTNTQTTTVIVQDSKHRDLRTDISAGLVAGGVNRQMEVLVKR